MNSAENAGQKKRTASIIRTEKNEGVFVPAKFSVWCPQVIAGIGEQRGTLHDRSVCIELRRKLADEQVNKLPLDGYEQGVDFRRKCIRWADDNAASLRASKIEAPEYGNDRAQDNWKPMFAIAEATSKAWLKKAEDVYLLINAASDNAPASLGVTLLTDIREIFDTRGTDKIFSDDLVDALVALEERPWIDLGKGRTLTQATLAKLLKPYRCKSGSLRIGVTTRKGYHIDNFEEVFARYL